MTKLDLVGKGVDAVTAVGSNVKVEMSSEDSREVLIATVLVLTGNPHFWLAWKIFNEINKFKQPAQNTYLITDKENRRCEHAREENQDIERFH